MDLVSVIVPVYKVEKYIHECINSIINQSYDNLEIILVDDGSPDNCGDICDNYALLDNRVKVIHKENGGLSDARNAGLNIAKGEYIVFVDSDDYIDVDMISILYKRIKESRADMAICNYLFVNENNVPIREKNAMLPKIDKIYTGLQILRGVTQEEGGYFVTVWNRMYRKELWKNIRFPKGKQHEDEYILHEICLKCSMVVGISRPLYNYRQRKGSIMSSQYDVKRLDVIEAWFIRARALYNIGEYELSAIFYNWALNYLAQAYNILDRRQSINKDRLKYLLCMYRKGFADNFNIDKSLKNRCFHLISYVSPYQSSKIKKAIHKMKHYAIFLLNLLKYRFSIIKKKYVLLDTPVHGNLGDHAIAIAVKQFVESLGEECAEATADKINNHEKLYANITSKNKIILIPGGGFLGYLWPDEEERFRRILKTFKRNRIIVFPQTVTFDMKSNLGQDYFEQSHKIYTAHKKMILFVREKKSYNFMKEHMPEIDVFLAPDIVLSLDMHIKGENRNCILFCMRSDKERNLSEESFDGIMKEVKKKYSLYEIKHIDTVINRGIKPKDRELEVKKKLNQFSQAKLVITDRLHGMIFAAITNTPCIAVSNSNGKVKGVYEWIKRNTYIHYVENEEEFIYTLDKLDIDKHYQYNRREIKKEFAQLNEILKGC